MTGREAIAGLCGVRGREQLGSIAELALQVVEADLARPWLTWLSESGSAHDGSRMNGAAATWSPTIHTARNFSKFR